MKRIRKTLAVLLSVVMLMGLCAATFTVNAAQNETIIIAGSDYQTHDQTLYIQQILAGMKKDGITNPDKLFFVGDYSLSQSLETSTTGINELKTFFSGMLDETDMIFSQGNHDLITVPGLTLEGNHDPAYGDYGLYIIDEDNYAEWGSYNAASVAALQLYLENKISIGWNKPIFILNHIPLHWSNRTQKDGSGTNAYKFFNVINDAAGQGLNIIYLFGHNHSNGYDDSMGGSCIFLKKGDTIEICQGTKTEATQETLNFTYMNAGYTGYYELTDGSTAEDTLTMSVFRIRGNEVIISRYSADGAYNLKSAGYTNPNFTYTNLPTTNTTVYSGSYKLAADGTATPVDTVRDMGDNAGVFTATETSTSEDVKGLAFKFDVTAAGVAATENNEFVNDTATVDAFGDSTNYKLMRMGAIVTNNTSVGTDGSSFFLDKADGGRTIDIPAVYLCELEDASTAFAVRITNIPDSKTDAAIYARPYYVFDLNGTEITVYGDIVGASYNGKLSENDGELEW